MRYIKYVISSTLVFIMILCSAFVANAASSDADTNKYIFEVDDATRVQKYLADYCNLTSEEFVLYDMNKDDDITVDDVTIIQKYIADIIDDKEPSELSFDIEEITLGISEEYQLEVISDVDSFAYELISSDSSIAEVDEDGNIKAIGAGVADIVCTTKNGLSAKCVVTVKPLAESISLNISSITLGVGESFDIDSKVPSGTAAYYRNYFSANGEVATVTYSGGVVTALNEGTTSIICAMRNGVTAVCTIKVLPHSESITLNADKLTLGIGEEFDLNSYVPSGTAAYYRNYFSDNEAVATATFSGGIVKAISKGTAVVSCIMSNGIKADCVVAVGDAPKDGDLSIDCTSKTLKVGNSITIKPTIKNSVSNTITFESSNPYVATVDSNGNVKAMSLGTADITVKTYNGISKICKIKVEGTSVKCIDVSTWQGSNIDFNKVKAAGIEYVIIRAGFGDEKDQKDNQFENNYKKAKAAGLKVGVYWFSYSTSVEDSKLEAETCLYCIGNKQLDLPVYYDMEYEPAMSLGTKTYTNMAVAFCEKIKQAGYKPGIYASASVYSYPLDYSVVSKYSIWNAEWNDVCTVKCDLWQYTESGWVDGISDYVDMSYIYNLNILN